MRSLNFLLLILALTVVGVLSHQEPDICRHDSECYKYSEHSQFVDCVSGKCVCLNDEGFTGNATSSNKCRCVSFPGEPNVENNVDYSAQGGGLFGLNAYCLNVAEAVKAQKARANCALNKATIKGILDTLVWHNDTDNPLKYIYSAIGLPSNVSIFKFLDPNYKLRVPPFGMFDNPVDAYLYYAVFAVNNIQVPAMYYPYLFCENNLVYVRADIGFGFAGTVFLNITEVATYTMTPDNKAISGDAYAINIPAVTAATTADQEAFIIGVCKDMTINPGFWPNQTHGFCGPQYDSVGYYANYNDCIAYLHTIPFGDYTDAQQKTVVCAREHATMAFYRPEVHCVHAGKNDVVHCTFHSYADFYQHTYKKRQQQSAVSDGVGPYMKSLVARSPPLSYVKM